MKITTEHIASIRNSFEKMQTRNDLLQLLNEVKPLIYGEKSVPFELKQLTWYANPRPERKRYKEFTVKKKSGGDRTINAPVLGLKAIQKVLGFILQCVFEPHEAAMGFTRGRSVADNARIHAGRNYVYNIDLKDFFSSIDQARVWKCLQLRPFNLNKESTTPVKFMKWTDFKHIYLETDGPVSFSVTKERMWTSTPLGMLCTAKGFDKEKDKYVLTGGHSLKSKRGMPLEGTLWLTNSVPDVSRLEIANIIASLCCTEMEVERKNNDGEWVKLKRNVLPQGAPTSPVITNMVCQRLDFVFTGVAKRFGLKYSRYVDDITFSSMHNVFQPESDFLKEIHRIISEQGFHVNESKTRLQKRGYRQEVTGLLVNEKANVQKRYIKQIRMWLYYWETYGYGKATSFFLKQYKTEKVQVKNGLPDMANVIGGKLDYLKMVKGGDDVLYFKLKKRFDVLLKKGMQENIVPHSKAKEEELSSMYVSNEVDGTRVIEISNNVLENLGYKREKEKLFPIRHNPKELVSLLRNFSVNDSPLKYTTHSWDAGRDAKMFKDLNQFLDLAKKQYSSFSFHLKTLSENLNGKIYNFLFNKNINEKGWGVYRIKFGWSSLELLNACEMKQEMNPEDFVLPSIYQIQVEGKTIQKFKQIIDIFKNEIEIRDENSALYNLLIKRHETYLLSFTDPIINSLENKTFYTDVQWLSKALDQIFENIQNRPQHRLVKYSIVNEKEESFELEILHVGSFNTGKSIYDEKLSLLKGNFGDICKYLKNLCDWSIESQFAEGYYRINYLTSMDSVPPYQKIENAEGFKHILTFYK